MTYILAWLPMIAMAIANGVFRESIIKKMVGDAAAHRLSTLTLLVLLTAYLQWIFWLYPPASAAVAIVIGALWMVLTIAFEVGMGLFRGLVISAMLADYNLLRGRLWALVPLWLLVAPLVFFLLKK